MKKNQLKKELDTILDQLNGDEDSLFNQPHIFAMRCKNYGLALEKYTELNKKQKEVLLIKAGDVRMEGFKMSPFHENIGNASQVYFEAKNYQKSIDCSIRVLKDFQIDLSVYDTQYYYWKMVKGYVYLNDIKAEKYYLKAKELFIKVGEGSKDATEKFIFISKVFYEYALNGDAKSIFQKWNGL